ncbi:MAG: hypothetical protein R3E31_29285 [Chloroflexota bacterium]
MGEHVDEQDKRQQFTRRDLLRAGWTVPVIAAVELSRPRKAFAQGTSHLDYVDYSDHTITVIQPITITPTAILGALRHAGSC